MSPAATSARSVESLVGWMVVCLNSQAQSAVECGAAPEAAVEAERVFVQVGLHVLAGDRAVMCAEEPCLQVRDDSVDMWHVTSIVPAALGYWLMIEAVLSERGVSSPAIGMDDGAMLDTVDDEGDQSLSRSVPDTLQSHATRSHAIVSTPPCLRADEFDRQNHQDLRLGATRRMSSLRTADVGLVDLHFATQRLAPRCNEGGTESVEQIEGGLITPNAHLPLKLQCGNAGRERADEIGGVEPGHEILLAALHQRRSRHTCLMSSRTLIEEAVLLAWPSVGAPASRAHETVGKAKSEQVLGARLLRTEAPREVDQIVGWPEVA